MAENKDRKVFVAKIEDLDNQPVEVLPGHTVAQRVRESEGFGFSEVVSTMEGEHPKLVFPEIQVEYKIIDGIAKFKFSEDGYISLFKGANITIPAGRPYSFEGKFTCFMRCDPGFVQGSSILVDDDYQGIEKPFKEGGYEESILICNDDQPIHKNSEGLEVISVFSGTATFMVDGLPYVVSKSELIVLPKNTSYSYSGLFSAFVRVDYQSKKENSDDDELGNI